MMKYIPVVVLTVSLGFYTAYLLQNVLDLVLL
jgi:hypothetical protein